MTSINKICSLIHLFIHPSWFMLSFSVLHYGELWQKKKKKKTRLQAEVVGVFPLFVSSQMSPAAAGGKLGCKNDYKLAADPTAIPQALPPAFIRRIRSPPLLHNVLRFTKSPNGAVASFLIQSKLSKVYTSVTLRQQPVLKHLNGRLEASSPNVTRSLCLYPHKQ